MTSPDFASASLQHIRLCCQPIVLLDASERSRSRRAISVIMALIYQMPDRYPEPRRHSRLDQEQNCSQKKKKTSP